MMGVIRNWCLYVGVSILILSNLVNYFYAYKHLNDIDLEWRIAMYAIAIELFLFSLYIFITEIIKRKKTIRKSISGWMTVYLLINLIGVCMGFTLHTKGFMAILFVTTFLGIVHIIAKLWQKYF